MAATHRRRKHRCLFSFVHARKSRWPRATCWIRQSDTVAPADVRAGAVGRRCRSSCRRRARVTLTRFSSASATTCITAHAPAAPLACQWAARLRMHMPRSAARLLRGPSVELCGGWRSLADGRVRMLDNSFSIKFAVFFCFWFRNPLSLTRCRRRRGGARTFRGIYAEASPLMVLWREVRSVCLHVAYPRALHAVRCILTVLYLVPCARSLDPVDRAAAARYHSRSRARCVVPWRGVCLLWCFKCTLRRMSMNHVAARWQGPSTSQRRSTPNCSADSMLQHNTPRCTPV
jgi:hypothetical protein